MKVHTAELLERITDAAKFERLATLVLRKADTRFEPIMHLGINARGQPIAAPNDGFCQVPGTNPPQFLWVQHTIESRDSLRGKWLSDDDSEPGDLIKAAREADALRPQFPTGKFIVILSTNQRLPTERKKNLANDIYTTAKDKGIEAIIWEQSRYRDFLDSHPDGQWFRKEFFGIEAEWLSEALLANLSQKSLAEYATRQFTTPISWITRQLDTRTSLQSGEEVYTVKLILGESGFGKSATAYRLLRRHIEAGGYGLYIPERIFEEAISLEDALQQTLRRLYPSLLSTEVEKIPSQLGVGSSFLIVVDDVNQANNPPELIRKLVGWAQEPYLIICPAWPRFWNPTKAANIKAKIDVMSIDRMPFDEAIGAVQRVVEIAGHHVTPINTRMIAGRLRGDPLLIGTFGALLSRSSDKDMLSLADNVVETYIAQYIDDATNVSKNKYFGHEYYDTLDILTATMLHKKNLYPHWRVIEEWLHGNPKQISIIRDLSSHGKLCQVSENGEFRFQHDRFLEHFCVRAIGPLLAQPAEYHNVLAEPYYAELIGRSLIKYPQSETILNQMLQLHPLALAFAVQELGTPTTSYHHIIVEKVQHWVRYSGAQPQTPETLRGAVANCFINTDSPAVLDIVHTNFGLEVPWLGDMARLRNGDLESGVNLFVLIGTDYREDSFITELVQHSKQYHGEQLRVELLQALSAIMEERTFKGTVLLAGYLGFPGLQEAIVSSWQQQSNRAKHLDIAIWAVVCSETERENSYLDTLIEYWADMPDIEEEHRAEYQLHTAEGLRRLLGKQTNDDVVQYLIKQAQKRPQLGLPVGHICGRTDLPQAIEFAVRQAARREDWRRTSSLSHWASFDNPRLSPASVSSLEEIWKAEENLESVRQVAFRVWLDNVNRETINVLPLIQPILADSPLYIRALQERALLGDNSCMPGLLEQLEAYPGLYYVFPRVWSESLKRAVSVRLQSFSENIPNDFSGGVLDEHYLLAPTLTEIPIADAEELLSAHWRHLRYSRLFLQAAVFVGTPKTLALVDEVIGDYPSDVDPFKHLDVIYGFYDRSREKRLTLNHLKHLEPYMAKLSDNEQSSCAEFCYRQGGEYLTWCTEHLSPEVNKGYRLRYMLTEEDVLRRLDMDTTHLRNHTLYILDQFRKEHDPAKFLSILRRWLQNKPTWQKVEAAANCIEQIGWRADVVMLDVSLEYEWEKHHIKIVRESTMFGVCRRTLS